MTTNDTLIQSCKAAVAMLSQPIQFTEPDSRVFENRPVQILRGDARAARKLLQSAISISEAMPSINPAAINPDWEIFFPETTCFKKASEWLNERNLYPANLMTVTKTKAEGDQYSSRFVAQGWV